MRALGKIASFLGLAEGAYLLFIRPRMLRWGATEDEVRGPSPGEGIVPGAKRGSIMAITLNAPPSAVWPWLAQMGNGRGGWYSWDRLDNAGVPSVEELHPEWQSISLGQRLPADPTGKFSFEVAALEPERFLGLRATNTLTGQPYDPNGPRPRNFGDSLWAFQLKELPGERTRLIVSTYGVGRPRALFALQNLLFWEPAHWMMQTRQFANLKRRAERSFIEQRTAFTRPSPPEVPAHPPL